jgi:hypothetical protein
MNLAVGVEALTKLHGASRYARSYAFLYAAFKATDRGSAAVKDIVGCLTPFVAPYLARIPDRQLKFQNMQAFLRTTFGFDIPIYALHEMVPALRQQGLIAYKAGQKILVAVKKESSFLAAREEIETDFDEIAALLASYATVLGFIDTPPSGSWGGAIINFLKPDVGPANPTIINLKGVFLGDARDAERRVVAMFIQRMYEEQPTRYEKIVKIFMGTLVEDFLSGVSEVGELDKSFAPVVLCDTDILLRSLDCCGTGYRTATAQGRSTLSSWTG